MKRTNVLALTLIASLSLLGCRSGGDDDGDDADDDGTVADDTIFDLHSDEIAVGDPVTVRDVVVVAVDAYGGRAGGIYVMEPEGGAFSGVFVFLDGGTAGDLSPGDIVDIEGGVKDEFALDEDTSGRTLTEISAPQGGSVTVTQTGEGEIPEPETLQPWDLAADDDESEKWEGVLVRFENVRIHRGPQGVSSTDETLQEILVTGPYAVQSALTGLADTEAGTCYSEIVGIGEYFFNYKILPRSQDDLVEGDDGDCLPVESAALCGDDADNDYNGFADCDDFSCLGADACPSTATTVADIQSGEIEDGTVVILSQVVVTGVSFDRPDGMQQNRTFWVADAAAAAESNGVAVFWPESSAGDLPVEIVVGRTLDLQGTLDEFPCLEDACIDNPVTQLGFAVPANYGTVVPAADILPLTGVDLATVATDPGGEPYEGVLVRFDNVEVVSAPKGDFEFSLGVGDAELLVDDVIFRYREGNDVTVDQCLTSIIGVLHRDIFGDFGGAPIFLPRSIADIDATPGTCE